MDSSIYDPDLSTESGREQMEADYCHEPPPTQVNQAEGAAGDEDDEGDYEGWEEAMEAIEGLPIYDPDASYGSNPAPECKTPPDASFGPGEEEADETMGDPSKLSSIGGFFSDSEEEPEPLHSPQYYEKKEYQDAEEEPEEQEELQDAEEEPEEQEELQDGEEEEGQDSEEESDEEPDEVGQPDDKADLDEEKLEAYFEAADAELAAQIEAQQAAEAEAGGKELMRQLSGGGKSKKVAAAQLVRAPDSSSREPDFEDEDEAVVSKEQVVFEKLPPKRAGGRYLLSFQGYKYSVSKPAKEDQAKEKQRWRMRCSSHGGGRGGMTKCRVSFFVDGNDKMLDEPVKVFHHTCGRPDAKEVCREKIRGQIRELVAKAFEEGHYYRFSNEVKKIFRQLTDRELREAEWTLIDLVRYAYTHSRWKLSLPNPPSDFYFSWPDETKFLMRDPGHEGTKHNILLWDSGVFQFKTKRNVDKDGRILVLGEDYIRRYVERGLVDGALIDGTYACAPKGFSQLFNVLFRVVLKRDAAGKPCKVSWIHGVSACLTSHDYGIYHRFFQWLKDWIGDWNPSYVASDYEIAATAAFRAVWANVCQISCRFHLAKGIRDRITKLGFMQEFIADARSRRMLRFLMAVAYVPTEELAREVLEKFLVTVKPKSEAEAQKPFFTDILPYLQKTFIGILVKPSVPASEGKDAVPAVWKKPRYALKSWLRHQPALNSWPTTTNAIESFHRMIKRSSCPNPGLWNLLDLIGHVLELNRGRLRVIDSLLEKESEAKDLDGMFDAYGVDFDVTEMEEDGFKDGGEGPVEFAEHSPVKAHQKKLNKKVRWVNGASETSASVLKDNPVALEYVSARVGAVERLSSGYLPLEVARRDMDQPFSCLEEGVRKWLAYQDSSDLRYLYVRKMACLISGFGVPKVFRMSRRESKLFRDTFSKWSAYEANLVVEEDDEAEEECSDTEGVAVEANAELKNKERRESMAAGLMQSVPVVEGEEELAVDETGPAAEAKSKGGKAKSTDGKAKSTDGKAKSKGGKGSGADKASKPAVGSKVGGKAGGASGKGSGADKASKPAVGSKVGGKAGGASGKGSGADKASKPAVGSKVGGKAGGASGKGSGADKASKPAVGSKVGGKAGGASGKGSGADKASKPAVGSKVGGKAGGASGKGSGADKASKPAVGSKVGGKAGGASGKGSGADKASKPAVGSKVGGKAGGASGKGSGADKASKPAVGSKVGGKAGGASGKGSGADKASKPAVGSKVGGKAGGASGKGSGADKASKPAVGSKVGGKAGGASGKGSGADKASKPAVGSKVGGKAGGASGKGSGADKASKPAVGSKVGGKAGGASGKGSGADKASKPAVGSKVGGKAGGASGKGSGADKASKPAVGSKVGGKAGGASGKGSGADKASKPAVGSKVGGKAGGASGKGSGADKASKPAVGSKVGGKAGGASGKGSGADKASKPAVGSKVGGKAGGASGKGSGADKASKPAVGSKVGGKAGGASGKGSGADKASKPAVGSKVGGKAGGASGKGSGADKASKPAVGSKVGGKAGGASGKGSGADKASKPAVGSKVGGKAGGASGKGSGADKASKPAVGSKVGGKAGGASGKGSGADKASKPAVGSKVGGKAGGASGKGSGADKASKPAVGSKVGGKAGGASGKGSGADKASKPAVGSKVGGKAGGASGKGSGADKASKPAVGSKVGGKAGGASGKGSGADKASKPAVGSKVGGKAGGASGKGSSVKRSSLKAGQKFDSSKTDKLASASTKNGPDESSDSEGERPLASLKRVSGERKVGVSPKALRMGNDPGAGTSAEGVVAGEADGDAEDVAEVQAPKDKKKRRKKSFTRYSPKNLRSKSKLM